MKSGVRLRINLLLNNFPFQISKLIIFNLYTNFNHLLISKTMAQSKPECNFLHIARMALDNS